MKSFKVALLYCLCMKLICTAAQLHFFELDSSSTSSSSGISTSESLAPQETPRDTKSLQIALSLLCPRQSETIDVHK